MADEKTVNVVIRTTHQGKGAVDLQKALEKVETQANKTNKSMAEGSAVVRDRIVTVSSALNIVKTAWGAVRGTVNWLMESVEMANKNARSVNMLAAAYNAVGFSAKGALDKAKAFATEMQNLTGIADEVFLDGQRLLANYGIVGQKAQESIKAAYALSVGIGTSLESALTMVAKAAAGSTSSLSRYGIVLGDNVKEGEKFDAVLKQINDKFGASAQATIGDMTSKVGALKERWGDLREEIGNYLIPALQNLITWGNKAIDVLNNVSGKNKSVDQMAYEENQKRIQQLKKEIELEQKRANARVAMDEETRKRAKERVEQLNKELTEQTKIQIALENDNYERAKRAKIDDEIVEKQAEQINQQKTLKQQAVEQKEAQKAISDELERQQKVLNSAGVGPRQTTSGWDTSNYTSQGQTDLGDIVTGINLDETSEFLKQIEEQKAGLEDLYNKKLELLEQGNLDAATYAEAKYELDRQYATQTALLEEQLGKRRQQTMATMWNNLVSLQSSSNKKMAAVGKASAIAQTTIATYQSATEAYKAMAGIPIVGPALAVAAAAAAIAAGLNNVAQISGVQLAEGGLVKAVTGGVPAVIGEGGSDEAVLPLDNSKAMQRIGGAIAEESGAVGGVMLTQNITIQAGESLIPDITNALRNATVDALEMANLTVKVGNSQQGLSV